MKRKNTLWSLVLALVMVLGVFAPLSALAEVTEPTGTIAAGSLQKAKPTTTAINIHKLQADSFSVPKEGLKHNGGEITDFSGLGTNVKPLAGVTFTYFKVSEAQFAEMKKAPGSYDTVEKVKAKYSGLTETNLDATNAQGVATANLGDGYYWFVESDYTKVGDGPDSVSSYYAVPFGISLPLMNTVKVGDNEPGTMYMNTVHIYPKNVTGNEPTPEKDVNEIDQKNATFDIGKPVDWIIKAVIPANIKDYYEFSLTDKLDEKLTYKADSAKVYYGNFKTKAELEKATPLDAKYYTLTYDDATKTLKVVLNTEDRDGTNYVMDLYNSVDPASADNKLYVKFQADINDKAIMGQDIKNGVDLTFKNKSKPDGKTNSIPEDEKPKVVTGGKLFEKVDSAKAKKLEGAVFTIKHQKDGTKPATNEAWNALEDMKWTNELIAANKAAIEAGKFAKNTNGEATTAVADVKAGDTIYLRSVKDTGAFEIKGLEFSKYTPQKWDAAQKALVDLAEVNNYYALKEVKAPEGFGLNENAIEFTIDKTSYYTAPDDVTVGTTEGTADPLQVVNKELTIPQTGGMGTMIFMVAGLALMGGAFIAMRKRSAEQA